jgi:hypothetical protein
MSDTLIMARWRPAFGSFDLFPYLASFLVLLSASKMKGAGGNGM